MIVEQAVLPVEPDQEADFERAFAQAKGTISTMPGTDELGENPLGGGRVAGVVPGRCQVGGEVIRFRWIPGRS